MNRPAFEVSRHCSMAVYWFRAGRWSLMVTNRPPLFEEKLRPRFRGWWFVIIRRAA